MSICPQNMKPVRKFSKLQYVKKLHLNHSFEFGHSNLSGFFQTFDQVKVMDTVGCGDSFVAAIAFGFIHNIPLVTTLAFANAVGCGAGRNVATLKQVVELMEAPDLNEDDEFWNELLGEHLDTQEVTFLSRMVLNGSNGRMTLQKVVSELLPKLKYSQLKGTVSSLMDCNRN